MTTVPALEPTALEQAGTAVREGGLLGGARALVGVGRTRLRQGEFGMLPVVVGLAAIWAFFQAQQSAFLSARNLSNLVLQIAVTGTVAVGVALVLLLGEIDLSVGSVAGLCSAVIGVTLVNYGLPWWGGIAFALVIAATIGTLQGASLAFVGVPSFVVTLAGLLVWQGAQLRVLGVTGTINVFDTNIGAIANSYLPNYWGWIIALGSLALYAVAHVTEQVQRRRAGLPAHSLVAVVIPALAIALIAIGAVFVLNLFRGVPVAGVILLSLVIFFSWVTTGTKFGRYVYAVGGNAEAARRAGINVTRIRISVFALSSTLAGVGGLISVSRLAAASTLTGQGNLLLESIAAAVIGGVSLFGGRGSVWGALLGALVIGSVANGLDLVGQPPEVKLMVEGGILFAAVSLDALSRRGRAAAGV